MFLMHVLDHVNLQITAAVYLIKIAGEDFTNAQMRIIGHVKFDLAPLDHFFLGRMLARAIGFPGS